MIQQAYFDEIKLLLDSKIFAYNRLDFIDTDPVQIPHRYSRKEDIEIAGFLTATIAWGQRKSIIKNASALMDLMDNTPFEFLLDANDADWQRVSQFVHRTFNGNDCLFFLKSLKNIYQEFNGLENVFNAGFQKDNTIFTALEHFRKVFLSIPHDKHVSKHVSDVTANSAAKRLNMFLRWMVRNDGNEVDFGLWKKIPASALMLPLDVHTGDVARALGILSRTQNDWKSVIEITNVLRTFDANDPIKYDFALFGIGVFEGKNNIQLPINLNR